MRRRIVVAEFENVFGLLRSCGTNERRCEEQRRSSDALKKGPATRSTHGHSPISFWNKH
jgi:hypothetical protein